MDSISEQRLGLVWPILADSIRVMAESLEREGGLFFRVVQGLRTSAEQDAIWDQGRTTAGSPCSHVGLSRAIGTCLEHPLGLTVTNAKGGQSWHNFGMAVDCVPSLGGNGMEYQPDWDIGHVAWVRMWDAGRGLGLNLGHDWNHPDNPHFQLTGQYPWQAPDDEVRQIAAEQGLKALWGTVKL